MVCGLVPCCGQDGYQAEVLQHPIHSCRYISNLHLGTSASSSTNNSRRQQEQETSKDSNSGKTIKTLISEYLEGLIKHVFVQML